jgi:pilus assembly protein CpaF
MSQITEDQQQINWIKESGPIQRLLLDPEVSEIMVNNWKSIFYESKGVIQPFPQVFKSEAEFQRLINTMALALNKEVNIKHPIMEGAFSDGLRVTVVSSPVSVNGTSITIRKPSKGSADFKQLVAAGTLTEKAVYFLAQIVKYKVNIVVCGGTGSGKTTFLNVISSFIPQAERLICIEENSELNLQITNLVRMETILSSAGKKAVEVRDLLKTALRMRPDRIVIGECIGAEAYDFLMAMNTGHDGCMTTIHSNSAEEALRRIEAMIIRSGLQVPLEVVRKDIGESIHFVVHLQRESSGQRVVTSITEVHGYRDQEYQLLPIFARDTQLGVLQSCGIAPHIVARKPELGKKFSSDFFEKDKEVSVVSKV